MERRQLYIYAGIAVIVLVLLVVAVADYASWQSANAKIDHYGKLQKELSKSITYEYSADMDAATRAWIGANQARYVELQNQGIVIEPDTVRAQNFLAVLDPKDPSSIDFQSMPEEMSDVQVYLGQYYADNMTRVPGWMAIYSVNHTDHSVSGITSIVAENIAYEYYGSELDPTIYQRLGVSQDTVLGYSKQVIDCSYMEDRGEWLDVSEYRYSLRNTDVKSYLLIKTYVNASDQIVASADVSAPYFNTVTGQNL
jgi:hypothetical protein